MTTKALQGSLSLLQPALKPCLYPFLHRPGLRWSEDPALEPVPEPRGLTSGLEKLPFPLAYPAREDGKAVLPEANHLHHQPLPWPESRDPFLRWEEAPYAPIQQKDPFRGHLHDLGLDDLVLSEFHFPYSLPP